MRCLHCDIPMRAKHHAGPGRTHAGRGLCSRCYYHRDIRAEHARTNATAADLLEDVEVLLQRTSPERVAQLVGKSPAAIARLAFRHDRADLGRPFNAIAMRIRRSA